MSIHNNALTSNNAAIGLLSWLRTGNLVVDMFLAMLVPLVFRCLFEGSGRVAIVGVYNRIVSWMWSSRTRHECVRTISHSTSSRNTPTGLEQRNELLQKALALYFTEVVKAQFRGKAQVALTALHDSRWQYERPDRYDPLANYRLTWLAPEGEWVEMERESRIDFRQYTQQRDSGNDGDNSNNSGSKSKDVVYELRCTASEEQAFAKIDALIHRCRTDVSLEWYKTELKRQRDESRYFYSMSIVEKFGISNTDKEDDAQKYKRYKLSDHKRFDSLFFPEKDSLLTLLDDFEHKRGKFAISGFPHKLGLMLHGPPGTGKTSLIKALAHATKRSIISIPLGAIKTNQQLMDVMYDLKLNVSGSEAPTLEFKDVIFVIEEVDAASKVVLRRDAKSFSDDIAMSPLMNDHLKAIAAAAASAKSPIEDGPTAAGPKRMEDMMEALVRPAPDALNLAGILNVLDGVVDTPGRLIILTSNHPEKLDPALIRPGRVDRLLHLDFMKLPAAEAMIAHYFGGEPLDARQHDRLGALLATTRAVTPAMVEQLCARHATVDSLLDDLAAQAGEPGEQAPTNGLPEKETAGTAASLEGDQNVIAPSKPSTPLLLAKRQTSGGLGG